MSQLYVAINRLWRRVMSELRLVDLRLRGAEVGKNVEVRGSIEIGDARGLRIGDGVRIGANVHILVGEGQIELRNGVRIGNGVKLEVVKGRLIIDEHAIVNSTSMITCWSGVAIGRSTLIAPLCHITDRNHGIAKGELVFDQVGVIDPIELGDDVWIASSSIVLPGVKIANGAVIGANSVVNKSRDSHKIAVGSPARVIGERE